MVARSTYYTYYYLPAYYNYVAPTYSYQIATYEYTYYYEYPWLSIYHTVNNILYRYYTFYLLYNRYDYSFLYNRGQSSFSGQFVSFYVTYNLPVSINNYTYVSYTKLITGSSWYITQWYYGSYTAYNSGYTRTDTYVSTTLNTTKFNIYKSVYKNNYYVYRYRYLSININLEFKNFDKYNKYVNQEYYDYTNRMYVGHSDVGNWSSIITYYMKDNIVPPFSYGYSITFSYIDLSINYYYDYTMYSIQKITNSYSYYYRYISRVAYYAYTPAIRTNPIHYKYTEV